MSNQDQAEFWSGSAGASWVSLQTQMDALLAPVLDALFQRAELEEGQRVLDIGCGTGASTGRAAQAVGPAGHVLGADISPTLLGLAKIRHTAVPQISFLHGDVAEMDLPGPFDAAISRFGVMFFADTPAAFRNIAKAMRPGAQFTLAAWADVAANPYFIDAAAAARSVLGPLPKTDRTLPGPFAFEDADRVRRDLAAAGLRDIEIETCPLDLTPEGDLAEFADLCMQIGPAASNADKLEATEAQRAQIRAALIDKMTPYVTESGLRIPALIHIIQARV